MGKKYYLTPPTGLKIRWVGTVDFMELYRFMKNWLEDRGYVNDDQKLELKFIERRSGTAKMNEIAWHGEHVISEYFKYNLEVTFLLIGLTETDAQIGDVKKKLDKGDFEIKLVSNVEITDDKWEGYSLLKKRDLWQNIRVSGCNKRVLCIKKILTVRCYTEIKTKTLLNKEY